ncbi:MAG: phospholipid/cholesterol/gamma-HCH transport system substrate-binding protein [Solirubrobacteraceae bacterium]|nr:phospholipid/cholesterol/gamma-HCH transport system substrate-binding protein [Solirubrobacteraceae bacterium]
MRNRQSVVSNPVLIGAATTLVVIVAVFLAYNANNGLPFVPTYSLKVNVPSAAQLVRGNEVRVGGTRVGVIDEIVPITHKNGSVTAQLALKLDTTVKPMPVDSTVLVRPRSALGLKYVEITKGTSKKGFPDGSVVPLSAARPHPVEFDEVLSTFDTKTRAASRVNLENFGNAFAGRGLDLNLAIEAFNPLLRNLTPVMTNLSDPRTRLVQFVQALDRAAAEVAPVAETQAALFRNLSTTFGAIERVRSDYQQSIQNAPGALDAAIRSFPPQRPFLANSQGLFRELAPGIRALRTAAPTLADAFELGTGSLRRSVAFNERLKPTFAALQSFAQDPLVKLGVRDLTNLSTILEPTITNLAPVQTTCNYVTLWFRNVASLLSEGDDNGTSQRFIIIAAPAGPNNEGGPSSKPAAGPTTDNYLHTNPYPNTASPGQTPECEAANETYLDGQTVIGNEPGNQGTLHDITKPSKKGTQPLQSGAPQ